MGQNLWMVAIDDEGLLYKCGGKLCGKPSYAHGTARDWDPANPLATASNPDMLSRFLNTVARPPAYVRLTRGFPLKSAWRAALG